MTTSPQMTNIAVILGSTSRSLPEANVTIPACAGLDSLAIPLSIDGWVSYPAQCHPEEEKQHRQGYECIDLRTRERELRKTRAENLDLDRRSCARPVNIAHLHETDD